MRRESPSTRVVGRCSGEVGGQRWNHDQPGRMPRLIWYSDHWRHRMLPRFERCEQVLNAMLFRRVHEAHKKNLGIVNDIKKLIHHEGDQSLLLRGDGTSDETKFRESSAKLTITDEEAKNLPIDELLAKFDVIGAELALEAKKNFYLQLDETLNKYNRVTAVKGKLTIDQYLDTFRDLQMDFNPDGTPQLPQMVCGEQFFTEVKELLSDPPTAQRCKEEMDRIIEAKRKEWYAREAARELAD